MNIYKILDDIALEEGFSLKPYYCPAGKLTIGYGTNLDDGITKIQAKLLAQDELLNIKLELEDKLTFFNDLNEVRQSVLLRMAYNMGVPKLLKFKKTLKFIKNKEFEKASIEMLDSKWHRDFVKWDMQDGKRSKELRSEYLSKLMKKGEY